MDFGELIKLINNVWPYLAMFGGILWGWIQRKYKLPDAVVGALKALESAGISQDVIHDIFVRIGAFSDMNDIERREMARKELQHIADRNGIELSDSTANLIIEWVYKRLKK